MHSQKQMRRQAEHAIQIYTLGTLQVIRDGDPVAESDWRTRQARQLLKILITERPRPVATDRLIEILWPESAPDAAATTLRSAINALRNVLEPERPNRAPSKYIHTQAPGYAFRLHPSVWLDVEAFERGLAQAETETDSQAQRNRLEKVLALYRDDYLISDPYADWAKSERERLQERYFNGLLKLADLQARQGDYTAAISACRRILARDEVRENAYQSLMRYQAESGDSAAALLTYERCRHILSEELGADPSPITQQLHQRILNGEIETAAVATLSSRPLPLNHPYNNHRPHPNGSLSSPDLSLPQQTLLPVVEEGFFDTLVGREAETAHLERILRTTMQGQGAVVVLAGEAGVGKTRLAYQTLQKAGDAGATVISATCQRLENQLPYASLSDGISRYLQVLPDSSLRRLPQAVLGQLVQIIPGLVDRLSDDTPGNESPLSPEENRQRLIDGIVAFLTGLARLRPLVFFLDDLHWADAGTLAVLSRLSRQPPQVPIFLLLAYREEDLAENDLLGTLLHALKRAPHNTTITLERLRLEDVRTLVQQLIGQEAVSSEQTERRFDQLAHSLYATTSGNALFLTEALKALQERSQTAPSMAEWLDTWYQADRQLVALSRLERVQEIIRERIERLPEEALQVLQLAAVIGRDFSLDLLEVATSSDPVHGLGILLHRQFLIERLDERLDFNHQIVRQVVYDSLNSLLRRRLHLQVADALDSLRSAGETPTEIAFHYGQAGNKAQASFARYSVLAGEKLLRTFSPVQAIKHFDDALDILAEQPRSSQPLLLRAFQGRGLAYESLLDPDGVMETYSRLRQWALQQGDKSTALMAHTRLITLLGLVGQQAESNSLMQELIGGTAEGYAPALADMVERQQLLYSGEPETDGDDWAPLSPPPPVPGAPVADITQAVGAVHAALPLLIYGWTLRVQGQLTAAEGCLQASVRLSEETGQRSLASIAYHQLAVMARSRGQLERSVTLNEESKALNHRVHGTAAELASLWPRISSAYQALSNGNLDTAERRLRRVVTFLADRDSFRTHLNSAVIGLGLVALSRGDLSSAQDLLEKALSDADNRYPFTYVNALLGLAHIARQRGDRQTSTHILRYALRFAGRRSLVEEYAESVRAIVQLRPEGAPVERLRQETLAYTRDIGLLAAVARLQNASPDLAPTQSD